MAAKTERITILGTPEFKSFLVHQARQQGISVSEFVRRRCVDQHVERDEELLLGLINEVKLATKRAKSVLEKGISDVEAVIAELREYHERS